MKTGKVWGGTELLLATPFIEIHRLVIRPKARCSLHCHRHKWNAFYVIRGAVEIHVKKNDYDLVDVTTLGPGDFTTVKPGEYHFFESLRRSVVALEVYYPEPLSEDIVRKNVGGLVAKPRASGL